MTGDAPTDDRAVAINQKARVDDIIKQGDCPVEGCDFVASDRAGALGHVSGMSHDDAHRRVLELVTGAGDDSEDPTYLTDPPCECKVGRQIGVYDVFAHGLAEEYRERGSGASVTERFNARLVWGALQGRGAGTDVDADVKDLDWGPIDTQDVTDQVLDVLRDAVVEDDNPARFEEREWLQRVGIDLERLGDDFVSLPTMLKHLRECEGVDTSQSPEIASKADLVERTERTISRTETSLENTLEDAADDVLTIGDSVVVTVSATVRCDSCGEQIRLDALLDGNGCGCAPHRRP